MAEGKNTVWTFLVLVAAVGSLCAGFLARNKADMGSLASNKPLGVGLLASTDKQGETSEAEYFYEIAELLHQYYVEPVEVDQKMASGAVKGMVASLLDPESNFYEPEQFKTFQDSQSGNYSGIGVELDYIFNQSELKKLQDGKSDVDSLLLLPKVVISCVMPGSPAERAGLLPGDEIRIIQGKYLVTGQDIQELRDMQTKVTENKATVEQLNKLRDAVQDHAKNSVTSVKARTILTSGTEGEIQMTIRRNGKEMRFDVGRAQTAVPAIDKNLDGRIALRFFRGAAGQVQQLTVESGMVFDLRNSGNGNYDEMERSLAKFVSAGPHGAIYNADGKPVRPINALTGTEQKLKVTLIVDNSTIGAAATFAHILQASGVAQIQGTMPAESSWVEVQTLPDGSGYTLAIGKYSAQAPNTAAVAQNDSKPAAEDK